MPACYDPRTSARPRQPSAPWRPLLACAALALPVAARAQTFALSPVPVRLAGPAGAAWDRATALAPAVAPPRPDVVAVRVGATPGTSTGAVFEGGPLAPAAFPWPVPASPVWFTAGALNESPRAAALWSEAGVGRLYLGSEPAAPPWGPFVDVAGPGGEPLEAAIFAHLVATPRDVLVLAGTTSLQALDFAGPGAPVASALFTSPRAAPTARFRRLRLGPAARAGFHDVAWSRQGVTSLLLLWLDAAGAPGVAVPGLAEVVEVDLAPRSPDGGGAALDVDGDGIPDLVVSAGSGPATLLAVHNDDVPGHLATAPRTVLDARLGLADPRFVSPLELDGAPAIGVYDADPAGPEVVVATADGAGGFHLWRVPVPLVPGDPLAHELVAQLWAGDVAGGPAADLVVAYASGAIDVFEGDAPPSVAWAPGSPPAALPRGGAAEVEVLASDADGAVAGVELLAVGTAVASAAAPPYRLALPAEVLCGAASPLALVARATDDRGVSREVTAAVPLLESAPALSLSAPPSLALAPGGASLAVDAAASSPCGRAVTVAWSAAALPPAAVAAPEPAPGGGRLVVTLPEAAYPDLLDAPAGAATVGATAADGSGAESAPASVSVPLDATGLLDLAERSDRAALGDGELAVLTTAVASRLGVALRNVRIHLELDGLEAAGPVRASGARVLSDVPAPGGGRDVVLDLVPGGAAPLAIELPVRRTVPGRGGAARGQALAAASGVALSRPAQAGDPVARLPGCGCGADAGGGAGLAALALLVLARRRRARR